MGKHDVEDDPIVTCIKCAGTGSFPPSFVRIEPGTRCGWCAGFGSLRKSDAQRLFMMHWMRARDEFLSGHSL